MTATETGWPTARDLSTATSRLLPPVSSRDAAARSPPNRRRTAARPAQLSIRRDSMTEDEGRLQQIGAGRWIEASRPTPSIDGTSLILQIRRAAERDQVPVRVLDDEILGPPGLLLQGLVQGRAGGAELEVEWLDWLDRDVGRQQVLPFADLAVEDGAVGVAQVEAGAVAPHLRVEGRLAIGEGDREAELFGKEGAGRRDVGHEELGIGRGELRRGRHDRSWLRVPISRPASFEIRAPAR